MYSFTITEEQEARIGEWKEKIKKKYGEYGLYTYSFTSTGIGIGVDVYSHLAKKKKDFTDYDLW